MTDRQRNYTAISRAAWGSVFCRISINLGMVDILPSFVGYLLLLSSIKLLMQEEQDVALLRPFGCFLAVWSGLDWLSTALGVSPSVQFPLLGLMIALVNIYFHFQFLTNLAAFAERCGDTRMRWKGHGPPSHELRKARNWYTLLLTGLSVLVYLPQPQVDWWQYVLLVPTLGFFIVVIDILVALFALRKLFSPETE